EEPSVPASAPAVGEALLWRKDAQSVHRIAIERPRQSLKRHRRKYALGNLGDDKSFRFRGPEAKLDLKARNLVSFVELGGGVDEATWLYHWRRGDYSRWVREMVKDEELAAEIEGVEGDESLDAEASRDRVRELIETRYTAPATEG